MQEVWCKLKTDVTVFAFSNSLRDYDLHNPYHLSKGTYVQVSKKYPYLCLNEDALLFFNPNDLEEVSIVIKNEEAVEYPSDWYTYERVYNFIKD